MAWPKGKPRGPRRITTDNEPVRSTVRERKRKGGTLVDKFALPEAMTAKFKENGMSVEWKREVVYGAHDPSYDVFMREQGWEPVDGKRFPEYVGTGHTGPIRRDGLILCERPIELTREAMREEREAARDAVRIKEEQLGEAPPGQLQRHRKDGSSTVQVSRTIERGMEIE